jgi:hypothetical protein
VICRVVLELSLGVLLSDYIASLLDIRWLSLVCLCLYLGVGLVMVW